MAAMPKPLRAFDLAAAVDIYRVIGRRPTTIWVDASGRITQGGANRQPLREFVYWRTVAAPADQVQVQERLGGFFIVTREGACHPIALAPPHPIDPEAPFLHAQTARAEDGAAIESLLAAGLIVPGSASKVTQNPSRPGDRLVPADHPLIIDDRPAELDETPAPPFGRAKLRWN